MTYDNLCPDITSYALSSYPVTINVCQELKQALSIILTVDYKQ